MVTLVHRRLKILSCLHEMCVCHSLLTGVAIATANYGVVIMKKYCYKCMREKQNDGFCPYCGHKNSETDVPHHLNPGTILNGHYLVGNFIGEGGFGITYIGRDLTLDICIAIKEFYPTGYANRNVDVSTNITVTSVEKSTFFSKGKENFLNEARNVARFSAEPGIVNVRDYFEENNTAYIVMEYLDGVNLREYVKQNGRIEPSKMFELMYPLMRSLTKVHNSGIIHRDISPDNIMYMKDGTLKLMDFGSARFFYNEDHSMSVMLKQGYSPEEQYRKKGNQGPWTDVYGLCATIYRCITNVVPEESLDRLHNDDLKKPSELGVKISPVQEKALMYGLAVLPENRCRSMEELLKLLTNQTDIDELLESEKTRMADENLSYQDGFNRGNITQNVAQPKTNIPKKKNHTAIIVTAITILIVLILSITGVMAYIVTENNTRDKNDEKEETTIADTTETTIETTTVPETTEEETTEPEEEAIEVPATEAPTYAQSTQEFHSFVSGFDTVSASSTLDSDGDYSYDCSNVLDSGSSCWVENVEGVGVGEWIQLTATSEKTISGIAIKNGYTGSEEQYNANGKVTKMLLEFSDGASLIANVNVLYGSNMNKIQYIFFDKEISTSYVRVTILDAVEGELYDDTCISYIAPYI